jgi:hypothetical protein
MYEPEGVLLSGDSMGIILDPRAPTHPATPPPSVDLAAWYRTLEGWGDLEVRRFGPTHFGLHDCFHERRREALAVLRGLEARVERALAREEDGSEAFGEESWLRLVPYLGRASARSYFDAFSGASDWKGVEFHVRRRVRS